MQDAIDATRQAWQADFLKAGDAVSLTPAGRKSFYRAYELRMDIS